MIVAARVFTLNRESFSFRSGAVAKSLTLMVAVHAVFAMLSRALLTLVIVWYAVGSLTRRAAL